MRCGSRLGNRMATTSSSGRMSRCASKVSGACPTSVDVEVALRRVPLREHQVRPDQADACAGSGAARRDAQTPVDLTRLEPGKLADGLAAVEQGLDLLQVVELVRVVQAGSAGTLGRGEAVAAFPGAQALHRDAGELRDGADPVQLVVHASPGQTRTGNCTHVGALVQRCTLERPSGLPLRKRVPDARARVRSATRRRCPPRRVAERKGRGSELRTLAQAPASRGLRRSTRLPLRWPPVAGRCGRPRHDTPVWAPLSVRPRIRTREGSRRAMLRARLATGGTSDNPGLESVRKPWPCSREAANALPATLPSARTTPLARTRAETSTLVSSTTRGCLKDPGEPTRPHPPRPLP